ncbi:hypothetical protein BGX26_000733 [Mortierella sp. AD094]|nr:hypothetical protein BGX26_000733 [Mortierella sp. AD094]
MKITLLTALILALSSTTSASPSVVTLPIRSLRTASNLNAESLTRRYLQKRGTNSTSTSAPLTSVENDVCYTVSLGLGTPPQQFNMLIDTGSPITWVSSSSCTSKNCASVNRFDCAASSSCVAQNKTFNASYVSGQSVSGSYVAVSAKEAFNIQSLNFRAVAGVVTQNTADLPPTVDGLMGLWYVAQKVQVPILNILQATNALSQNIIGIWLEQNDGSSIKKTAPGGEITFGGLNSARFTGEVTYINNIPAQQWTIPVGGMKVGNTVINTNGASAAIDTGTTAMLVPKSVADAINGAIPNAVAVDSVGGNWFLPCSGNTPISITFGTFTINIPYTSLAIQSTAVKTTSGTFCQSAAMFPSGSTASVQEWLIGDVVLSNVYTVFDFGTNAANGGRIGFAQLGSGGNSNDASGSPKSYSKSVLLLQATAFVSISALFALL